MDRRHDMDVDDSEEKEEEINTDDLAAAACAVCARRPRLPAAPQVQLPASGPPIQSVAALVADARTLQRENQELRAHYELVSVHNVGLATHASVLHDRNLALLRRALEGYQAGVAELQSAWLSREHAELVVRDMEERVEDFRARAERTDAAETMRRVSEAASLEMCRGLQAQLATARSGVANLTARLAQAPAALSPSSVPLARLFAAQGERDDARAERDDLAAELATARAALPPVQTRLGDVEAERDQAQQHAASFEQERDDGRGERDRVSRILAAVKQERDGALDTRNQAFRTSAALRRERDAAIIARDQARQALATLERQRAPVDEELRVARATLSQVRAEAESARSLNVPLQDDLRRANALLVAHAEELRRGATRLHELEESVASATTRRVAAESEMTRAQAGELCAASRAARYRAGWLSMRRASQQRRGAVGAQARRLGARVVELERELDLAVRERDERAVAWRRMLRDARRGRELARRVRDELADRLVGVVTRVGGQIDTADLIRRLEATFAAEVDAAVPLPPASPTPTGAPVALATPASATPVPASTASGSGAPLPTPSMGPSLSGSRRPRHGASSHSGSPSRTSGSSQAASTAASGPSPLCRSQRPSTMADTAASASSAAQAPLTMSASAIAASATAAAAQAQAGAALFGSEASDSEDQARRTQVKRRRLRQPGSRSRPPLRSRSRSRSASHSRSASVSSTHSAGSAPPSRSSAYVHSAGSASPAGSAASRRPSRLSPVSGSASRRPGSTQGSGDSGDSSSDDSSSSSSSRASSSSTASSGSAGSTAAAPFFGPVIPPAGTPSDWRQPRYAPWPKRVRRLRLHLVTAQELRTLFLPPLGWIVPRHAAPEPANWNRALVTQANIDALYATRPWRYLTQAIKSLLFASGDAVFQPFLRRLRRHIEHRAQAYWESTHELPVPGAAWKRWRTARNSRRSQAGNHLNSLLQLAVELFHMGSADMDLLLDPMVLHFPPAHSQIGRWYPGLQHTTLQAALDDVDAEEPWRRCHRTPLTVTEMDAGARCRVTRDHPAYHLPCLAGKFIQQI